MSRPTHEELAQALDVPIATISQLARRGMPTSHLRKARQWFEIYGLDYHSHAARWSATDKPHRSDAITNQNGGTK